MATLDGLDKILSSDSTNNRRVTRQKSSTRQKSVEWLDENRALELNGSGELSFEMDEERSYLAVTIPIHEAFRPKQGAV